MIVFTKFAVFTMNNSRAQLGAAPAANSLFILYSTRPRAHVHTIVRFTHTSILTTRGSYSTMSSFGEQE